MFKNKKILFILFFLATAISHADERSDINQILREVNYLEEVVKQLKHQHKNSKDKVLFNYDALLSQLHAIKIGTQEYLNLNINSLHTNPPKTIQRSLSKVRTN